MSASATTVFKIGHAAEKLVVEVQDGQVKHFCRGGDGGDACHHPLL